MENMTTTDFADFGYRERKMAMELMAAMHSQGLPDDFWDEGVGIMMNTHSGNVFLTNNEYQAAMMNGNSLETFYSCPICGHEGFKEDMDHDGGSECDEYLEDIGIDKS